MTDTKNPTWLGRSYLFFIYSLLFLGSNLIYFIISFEFRVTSKAAVLVGIGHMKDLVACSSYVTN